MNRANLGFAKFEQDFGAWIGSGRKFIDRSCSEWDRELLY